MLSYQFKTCISDGREIYATVVKDLSGAHLSTKSAAFPESLLSMMYMDVESLAPLFQEMSDDLWSLTTTHEKKYAESVRAVLDDLALRHIYFEFLCLDWQCRIDYAQMLGDYTEGVLQCGALSRTVETIVGMQQQIEELFAHVLDLDKDPSAVSRKLTAYYRVSGDTAFQFQPHPMNYELLNGEVFAEVLCPNSIYDLIDYHLRECIKREVQMRRCKNCGRYFALTGHGGTEYCDRVCDDKGRTCREIGAMSVWNRTRGKNPIFTMYRKEYKKRFAWIKAGKITSEAFYSWSEKARKKKAECEGKKISLEEFSQWLANS